MNARWKRTGAVAIAALVGSAGLSLLAAQAQAPAAVVSPASPAGQEGGRQGRGQGRGGGEFSLIQEYPDDPNIVIQALNGFRVEIVARADRPTQGSWISLTEDDQGRLILGANEQQPFTRLTLDEAGEVETTEVFASTVSEAMGTEWHDGALYVQGGRLDEPWTGINLSPSWGHENGYTGLHRMRDVDGDGTFSEVTTLRRWDGDEGGHSDHGVHDPEVSPDGRHLYIINGNGVLPPDDVSPDSPLRHFGEDYILPLLRPIDRRHAPSGFLSRTDLDGQNLHLFAGGFRNALHFAWNADGEIFSFDSDHEPELGVPWYRPTRVFWAPSGADLGHREGSGKYPTYYEDTIPPLVEIGLASPVGVTFGYDTAFPALYQKALFVADNNYGRIIAVHLEPVGSGYAASSWENFVWPKSLYDGSRSTPHNVTDMMIARDGSFYYVIGDRRTQSYLMKVTYVGDQSTAPVEYRNAAGAEARALRHTLEAYHWTRDNAEAVDAAWPHLGSEDRFLRYAARVALETVSPDVWKARALAETDAATSLGSLLALARVGGPEANEEIFAALDRVPLATVPDRLRIQKLRVIEVTVARNGTPSEAAIERVVADVDAVFPAVTFALNNEMSQMLAAFNGPTVVAKTMRLADETPFYREDFAYRLNLRSVTTGWTPETRLEYFEWFNEDHSRGPFKSEYREWFNRVGQQPRLAGNGGPLNQVREAALGTLTDAEKADPELSAVLAAYTPPASGRGRGRGRGGFPFGQ